MTTEEKIKHVVLGLQLLGYPNKVIDSISIQFSCDGYLEIQPLLEKRVDPKDVMILIDYLIGQNVVPCWNERQLPCFNLYDNYIDLHEMNRWLKAYMERVHKNAPKQSVFVIEEISELTTELMILTKALTKSERGVVDNKRLIFEESCDVVAAILMMFVRDGYHLNDVLPYITSKYKRAVERFDENNAV